MFTFEKKIGGNLNPIIQSYKKHNIDFSKINDFIVGESQLAVELNDNNIGLCSILEKNVKIDIEKLKNNIDLNNYSHLAFLNAYYNALFNKEEYFIDYKDLDIFDAIDFSSAQKIVMIGYFKSLAKKLENDAINVNIFDKIVEDEVLQDMDNQEKQIKECDLLIMTSTTMTNMSFDKLISYCKSNCKIYLLGPSTILNKELLEDNRIKSAFGTIWNKKHKKQIFDTVKKGACYKELQQFGKKVYFSL